MTKQKPTSPVRACAVCAHVLDHYVVWSGDEIAAERWQHTPQDEPADHLPVPVDPGEIHTEPSCDFCMGGEPPSWTLPAKSFIYRLQRAGHAGDGSRGDWAVCTSCAGFIEHDDWRGLLHRALRLWAQRDGMPPEQRPAVAAFVWDRWTQLRDNVTGPLVPWDGRRYPHPDPDEWKNTR